MGGFKQMISNGAINAFETIGKSNTFGSLLGSDLALSMLRSKDIGFGRGVIDWMTGRGSATFGQRAARFGAAYMGVAAAGRILSGGGLYRDRTGRFNVIGVPFI
jgi:hypothetical protein